MLISPEHKAMVLPHREDVANLIPTAARISWKGEKHLVLPYRLDSVKLLKNLGVVAPSPIEHLYDWGGTTPFESQKQTAAMLTLNSRAYVLSSMGVGKTRAALYAYDYLRNIGRVSKALVVAPLSTLNPVWYRELFECFPDLTPMVLHGTREKRLKMTHEDADVFIINHDGVGVIFDRLLEMAPDVVIVDELANYRNRQTKRWKDLKPLVAQSKYAWGLTGSPTPNEPTDAYGQAKLLTPENVPYSFRRFKQQTMVQVTQFTWIPKKTANDTVYDVLQPAVRYSLDECHDLPPLTYSQRECELVAAQRKAYNQLVDTYAIQWSSGELVAANEAVRVSKLLQIACGFVYDNDGIPRYTAPKPRIQTTIDTIEEANAKVVVFAPFSAAVKLLEKVLGKRYSVARIDGSVSKKERDRIISEFRFSSDPEVIVAHPGTMSHGLTLVEADTIIWYAPIFSAETWEQANARVRRPGQKRHTRIVMLGGTSIENRIYSRLRRRIKLQNVLLEMFEGQS